MLDYTNWEIHFFQPVSILFLSSLCRHVETQPPQQLRLAQRWRVAISRAVTSAPPFNSHLYQHLLHEYRKSIILSRNHVPHRTFPPAFGRVFLSFHWGLDGLGLHSFDAQLKYLHHVTRRGRTCLDCRRQEWEFHHCRLFSTLVVAYRLVRR